MRTRENPPENIKTLNKIDKKVDCEVEGIYLLSITISDETTCDAIKTIQF